MNKHTFFSRAKRKASSACKLILFITAFLTTASFAQDPTPTPVMVRLSVSSMDFQPQPAVRLGSGQNVSYGLYIFLDSYTTSAKDVILTVLLPTSLTFVSTTYGDRCAHAEGIVTCNLGTITRYYPDWSAEVRIYARPQIDGPISITGKIKGSNANETGFSQTKIVAPAKSRKRVGFF